MHKIGIPHYKHIKYINKITRIDNKHKAINSSIYNKSVSANVLLCKSINRQAYK